MKFEPFTNGYYDTENLIPAYVRRIADSYFIREQNEKQSIVTVSEHEQRMKRLKEYFLTGIGGLFEEKTPLEAKKTGEINRRDFTIEKIIYQSLPGVYVATNLYVPKSGDKLKPGVLFLCGHSSQGKACDLYQKVCTDLVQNGCVVLAMDPTGQGERLQYYDQATKRIMVGACTVEHSYIGFKCALVGENILKFFLWDAIRAIDYLLSREDVDASKIGVTGNSGGGTQTTNLLFVEERIQAAAPCCFLTLRQNYMASNQAADSEQILWRAIAEGLNHDDYVTCFAPKPIRMGAAAYDYFCIEGVEKIFERAKRIYELYGKPENLSLNVSHTIHGFSDTLRTGVVGWFRKHLLGLEEQYCPVNLDTIDPDELNCTKTGQVTAEYKTIRTLFDVTRETAERLKRERNRKQVDVRVQRKDIDRLCYLSRERVPLKPRIISSEELPVHDGVILGKKLFYFTETGIVNTAVLLSPCYDTAQEKKDVGQSEPSENRGNSGRGTGKLGIVLLERGTNELNEHMAWLTPIVMRGIQLLVLDTRGIGGNAIRKINRAGIHDLYGTTYKLTYDLYMLGRNYLGDHVFDIVRAAEVLKQITGVEGKIALYGMQFTGLTAYFAGAFHDVFNPVVIEEMPVSYNQIVDRKYYSYDYRYHLHGVLKLFDLPQLVSCFTDRSLVLLNLLDEEQNVVSEEFLCSRYPEYCTTGSPSTGSPLTRVTVFSSRRSRRMEIYRYAAMVNTTFNESDTL